LLFIWLIAPSNSRVIGGGLYVMHASFFVLNGSRW